MTESPAPARDLSRVYHGFFISTSRKINPNLFIAVQCCALRSIGFALQILFLCGEFFGQILIRSATVNKCCIFMFLGNLNSNSKGDCRVGKYIHLSILDRRRLHIFLEMGLSMTEIAQKLSRNRSTIYRELERNTESGIYSPSMAQQKAEDRAKEKRLSKLHKDGVLRD